MNKLKIRTPGGEWKDMVCVDHDNFDILYSHGIQYRCDRYGIHQVNPQPFTYDAKYVAIYDTPAYKQGEAQLMEIRTGFVRAAFGSWPESLQDNGCGNGAFLKKAMKVIDHVWGKDVTGHVIEGCNLTTFDQPADVYTFWDVLEHIEDLSFLRGLDCKMIAVSLPYCHELPGTDWFDNQYKHRKPNEHVHHFNPETLRNTMELYGWHEVLASNGEDMVRKSTHGRQNIHTAAFKRK